MRRVFSVTRAVVALPVAAPSVAVLSVVALAGCTVGPDFQQPAPWWSPASWVGTTKPKTRVSEPVAEPLQADWWQTFHDPQLTALERRVAGSNLDVRVSTVRLAQSRAQLGVTRAGEFPTLNGNANYTREAESAKGVLSLLGGSSSPATGSNGLGGTTAGVPVSGISGGGSSSAAALSAPFNLYQYGFDASWELDFWGRVRRSVESSKASVTASEESQRDTLLTSLAELARDYVQLRGTQANIATTERNLTTAQQTLKLTQDRFAGGLTTELDVANAAAQVASTASQLPPLQQRESELINAISLLLGEQPKALQAELATPKPIPPVPPRVPVGLPSELARRRPDIRQAEAQLHAATADIGVAVADFYPRFSLSGSVALQSLQPKFLTDWGARTYGFGPSVTLPIFEGGRLVNTLELRKGQQQEAAINYQRTVLQALHDVDNALTAYNAEQRRRVQLTQAVAQNQRALDLARMRYTEGVIDFLTVLDAQRSLLATEQQLNDSTTNVSVNLVQLYKALGGGWQSQLPLPPPRARPRRTAL